MKRLAFFTALVLSSLGLRGQIVEDVQLFNTNDLHGTPRFTAMGGAFTSLGNDYSAIHLNPAGQSVFRNSSLGFTLGFQGHSNSIEDFYGSGSTDNEFDVTIENFGLVTKFDVGQESTDWSKLSFGVTFNQKGQFQRSYQQGAFNNRQSLSQIWAESAEGQNINNFQGLEEFAAWQAFTLVSDTNDVIIQDGYAHALDSDNRINYDRQENGNINEAALTFGGQYKSNFYYGISFGFPSLTYRLEENVIESGFAVDSVPFDIRNYNYNRLNEIQGNGFNVKLGIIAKPVQWWRVGVSYESPTWYTVDQYTEFSISSNAANGESFESDIYASGDYSYNLRTPQIVRFGTSFIIADYGILSFDYEYRDATQNNLSTGNNSFNINENQLQGNNNDIQNLMTEVHSFRAGAEARLGVIFLRGGFNWQNSLYEDPRFFTGEQTTVWYRLSRRKL